MNYPLLLQRVAHTAPVFFLACLITSLLACAPGTGGTGTGPIVSVLSSESITADSSYSFASVGSDIEVTFTGGGTLAPPSNSLSQLLPPCPALGAGQTRVTPTLSLSSNSIRYQQDCYLFTYQGSWEFDAALSLSVKGSVTQVLSATSPAQNASLQLRTTGSLATPAVQTGDLVQTDALVLIRAVLLDSNDVQALPGQLLQPSTP